jgi:hypothetical protein
MNAKAKKILVGVAFSIGAGLLAVNSFSTSFAVTTPVDRFASNGNYCKAFTGAQGVGTDGVSADFSVALGTAIQANGGDAKRTFSMIRAKCTTAA